MAPHTNPLPTLDLDAFGAELDALLLRTKQDLGERDLTYIRRVIRAQRKLELSGRALLFASILPPAWLLGTACLSLSKILENMEVGHNVLHGQYDFAHDPALASATYEWDIVCPASQWRRSHNYLHHTFTNVRGVDHDLGYRILRMDESQPWQWPALFQPLYASALAFLFEWGVAFHNLDVEAYRERPEKRPEEHAKMRDLGRKMGRQLLKDYVLFPLLAGPFALPVFAGNGIANLARNLWAFTVIFCGHFPEGTETFDPESLEGESRGQFYLRQLTGSANFDGSPLLHLLSGHLSHQIEHHVFPDVPAHRYPEMAVEVRALCEKHGVPYNTGSFRSQIGSVAKKICRLALPTRVMARWSRTKAVHA